MVKIDDRLLFGLYSWSDKEPNFRDKKLPEDPRDGTNEFNHIRNAGAIGKTVIEHLKSKCTVDGDNIKYYEKIKSLSFVPVDNLESDDIKTVQEMINLAYHIKSEEQKEMPWYKIAVLQKRINSGYSNKISEEILNKFAKKHTDLLDQDDLLPPDHKNKLSSDQYSNILIQSLRTCENISNIDGNKDDKIINPILLQDLLIPDDNKQLTLSTVDFNYTLRSNNKILVSPWIIKDWGYYSWSLQINKVSMSCILNKSGWFFPIRIIFNKHPQNLNYRNVFKEIKENKEKDIKYIGFFLIRYYFDEDDQKIIKCEKINNLDYFKAHESKEQYYVMLVFKNSSGVEETTVKYFLLNFRCNSIRWGTVSEYHRFLFYEIKQLMCMYASDQKIKFYLLLKKNINNNVDIKKLCKSQYEDKSFRYENKFRPPSLQEIFEDTSKKTFIDCFQAWLHTAFFDLLNKEKILPQTDDKSLHLLVSLFSIDDIFDKFNDYNIKNDNLYSFEIYSVKINDKEIKCIRIKDKEGEEYILFPCHFGYYNDIGTKDRLCIQYDDINNLEKISEFCITDKCLLERDLYIENIIQSNINVPNEILKQNFTLNIEDYYEKIISQQHISQSQQSPQILQPQLGGRATEAVCKQTNKYLQKINKKINKVQKLSEIYNNTVNKINSYNNLKINDYINYKKNSKYEVVKNHTYNIKNKKKFIKGNNINNNNNFIVTQGYTIFSIIDEIVLNNILIISSTINYIDKILSLYNNINVTFIVVNNGEIGSFLLLKEKYKNLKEIYFLGTTYNYNTYTNILKICNNQKFNTIIIDSNTNPYNSDITQVIGILLCNELLEYNGTFIICCLLLPIENMFYLELLYISYNLFVNHYYNLYNTININLNLLCYTNIKNKLSKDIENKLIDYLKNTNYNFKNKDIKLNINFSKKFLKYISYKWSQKILLYKENIIYEKFKNEINQNNQTGGFLTYHNFTNSNKMNLTKIPETIDDIVCLANYNKESMDFQYKCHWGQKKLLLSEIQFLTKVCQKLNIKKLNNYAVVYIGSAAGYHLPILYNLFPELLWLLYDPAPFSKEAKKHSNKSKVKIFNMFFTDDTIKHVLNNVENKKILFISDIRLAPEEESVMLDMINQVRWGTQLNADFMYLKFKSPYYEENVNVFKTNNINDLKLDKKIINNPDLAVSSASDNESFLYLKGDIYLQLYPNIHSIELRIFIEKINNKYELKVYNFKKIENIMANYNSNIKNCFMCNELCNDIPLDLLLLIPGYDISLECLMEYNIVYNYYKYILDINDKNKIVYKLYKMNRYLEILTHKQFIKCNLDTTIKTLKKYDNPTKFYNENTKLKIWKELCTLQISLAAKLQINLIKLKGNVLYSKDEIENIITYLKKFTIEKDYYILYNN